MISEYKNELNVYPYEKVGRARREELFAEALSKGDMLPKTVSYKDIDKEMEKWVSNALKIYFEKEELSTFVLYSNQRFSEYIQTWKHTDANGNLLMNFKTISRENNPTKGTIYGEIMNIPGNRYYTMKRVKMKDKNGRNCHLVYKMRQPMGVDLVYNVSIFTTHYQLLNEMNTKVNDLFKSIDAYIRPNGHYMSMVLDNITDESKYTIDDRQFFSQTYAIKVRAYILQEEDFKVEEVPYSVVTFMEVSDKKPSVEIYDSDYSSHEEDSFHQPDPMEGYYYKPVTLEITFSPCGKSCSTFTIDTDFTLTKMNSENIYNVSLEINGEKKDINSFSAKEGDEFVINVKRLISTKVGIIQLYGYTKSVIYDERKDYLTSPRYEKQEEEIKNYQG